ncbi:MAG: hypothetical protein NVSMB23_21010 [Myxococcales bacterium]
MPSRSSFLSALAAVALAACGTSSVAPAASPQDAGAASDGGSSAGPGPSVDAGGIRPDAGAADGGRGAGADAGVADGGRGAGADAGSGGRDGGAGDAGVAGARPLTSGESATHLAIDAANVYWTVDHPGARLDSSFLEVKTAPKAGGAARLLATVPGASSHLSVDGQAAYFLRYSCTAPCDAARGSIVRVPKGGGAPPEQVVAGDVVGTNFAADETEVFYSASEPPAAAGGAPTASIRALSKATLATRMLVANELPDVLAVDATTLYWNSVSAPPAGDGSANVRYASKQGGPAADLYGKQQAPVLALAIDFANVFVRGRDVYKVPKAAPALTRLAASSTARRPEVDSNASVVYWNGADGIFRVNAGGGPERRIDTGGKDYAGVRVDDTAVFFLRDGDVWRVAK